MAMLCCCGQIRHRKKSHPEEEPANDQEQEGQGLPARPPPARLPPPAANLLALSPQSTAARSSLTEPLPGAVAEASVQPGELIVEDSEDDDAVDKLARGSRNRSTSTLEAVKARIRRHLSQDSISRQNETEEQIAHRAHVKRLMRRRIQEELRTDTDNVDSRSSSPQNPGSTITIFGNGPRDTIEFTVDKAQRDEELAQVRARSVEDEQHHLWKTVSKQSSEPSFGKENRHPNSRPTSLRHWIVVDSKDSQVERSKHPRQCDSSPEIPASPPFHPVRFPSFHEASSPVSCRLSLSPDELAESLTPGKKIPVIRPGASPPESCHTNDASDSQSVRRLRSKSSPLVIHNSNTVRAHSSQVSLTSEYRRSLPASQSLIRDESPVGLWLRTQHGHFDPSMTSRPHSYSESGEAVSVENGSGCPIKQACLAVSMQSLPTHAHGEKGCRSHESLRTACSETQGKQPPQAWVSTSLVASQVTEIFMRCNANLESISQDCLAGSVSDRPLALSLEGSKCTALPSQSTARKGLGGLRLPSFKCRLLCSNLFMNLSNSEKGIIRHAAKLTVTKRSIRARACALIPQLQVLHVQVLDGRQWRLGQRRPAFSAEMQSFALWRKGFETLTSARSHQLPLKASSVKTFTMIAVTGRGPLF